MKGYIGYKCDKTDNINVHIWMKRSVVRKQLDLSETYVQVCHFHPNYKTQCRYQAPVLSVEYSNLSTSAWKKSGEKKWYRRIPSSVCISTAASVLTRGHGRPTKTAYVKQIRMKSTFPSNATEGMNKSSGSLRWCLHADCEMCSSTSWAIMPHLCTICYYLVNTKALAYDSHYHMH